jgi:site-specific DNA-cytosine methylase
MLENVKMKKEWRDIITQLMGVEPIEINSALVSAQNRKRLYWTNIPDIEQPEDRFIYLKDIIEDGEVDREKSYAVDANYFKGGNPRSYFEDGRRQLVFEHQSQKRAMVRIQGAALRNQVTKRGVEAQLNVRKDEKSNCVVPSYPHKLNGMVQVGMASDINGYDVTKRIYSDIGKSPTLTNMQGGHRQPKIALDIEHYRKLSVIECERLQTLEDNYTAGVSNTQRYKSIGNCWTIEVIAHIFRNIKVAEPLDT